MKIKDYQEANKVLSKTLHQRDTVLLWLSSLVYVLAVSNILQAIYILTL